MKLANGYKPFLYDITLDGCKFLRERNNPIANYFLKFISGATNLNHSCPYDVSILCIVEYFCILQFFELKSCFMSLYF